MNWNLAMDPNNQRSLTFRIGVKLDEFGGVKFDHLGGQFFSCWKNGGSREMVETFWKIIKSSQQKIVREREFSCWFLCSCDDSMSGLGLNFSALLKLLMHWKQAIWSTNNWDLLLLRIQTKKSFPPIPHQQPKSADTWKKIWKCFKRWFASIFFGRGLLGVS